MENALHALPQDDKMMYLVRSPGDPGTTLMPSWILLAARPPLYLPLGL